MRRSTIAALAALSVIGVGATPAHADDWDEPRETRRGPLFHPDGPGVGEVRVALGALVDWPASDIVEEQFPLVGQLIVHGRFGIHPELSLVAYGATNSFRDELRGGMAWGQSFQDWALGAFATAGVWYGAERVDSFDVSAWGAIIQPGLTAGFVINRETRLSVIGQLIVTGQQHTTLEGLGSVSRERPWAFGNGAFDVVVETYIFGARLITYGVGLVRAQHDYQLWKTFSDERRHHIYPRFMVAFAL